MHAHLVMIRVFEEYVLELAGAGLIHGPAHSSIGQEGGAVGSVLALTSADQVNGSHRGHHQFLAKALHHVAPKGLDYRDGVPDDVRDAAEGMGFRPLGRLVRVELPLALPVIVAGIRIATVTTIGLVTVTGLIGQGGLGAFIIDGINRDFRTPLVVGSVGSVALAVVADVLLAGAARLLAPWAPR
jgi:hypothetical protein